MRHPERAFELTNRLRTDGTDHLLSAGQAVGVRRFVAQSNIVAYARTGAAVKSEEDAVDASSGAMSANAAAIGHLEEAVLGATWTEGIALRYGWFYGPGTSMAPGQPSYELVRTRKFPLVGDGRGVWSFIHVADAADATVAAVERGGRGIYNVVDDEPAAVAEWLPALAEQLGAKRPMRVPRFVGRLLAGEFGVTMMTELRGASNAKAKRDLAWRPAHRAGDRGSPPHDRHRQLVARCAPEPRSQAAPPAAARLGPALRDPPAAGCGCRSAGGSGGADLPDRLPALRACATLGTGSRPEAVANAHRVLGLERWAGLDLEGGVQGALAGTPWMVLLDWVYLAAQTVALAGALVFVYRRSPPVYRALRTTLIATWALTLPVYALFPTAPPRLAGIGIADSVSTQTPFSLEASSTAVFFNPYAAVPSLHAAFAVALGIGVALCVRTTPLRIAAVLWGPLVTLAVLATGNHFVVDVAAGLVVTLAGFAAACLAHWLGCARRESPEAVSRPIRPAGAAPQTPPPASLNRLPWRRWGGVGADAR